MERVYINQLPEADNSIVALVNNLLKNAIESSASDIHIEPFAQTLNIRFRQDGLLKNVTHFNKDLSLRIASRIKVMANLDIAEKRMPQDGYFEFRFNQKTIDCRISTISTIYGEKIVIRLLNKNKLNLKLETLGFNQQQLSILESVLQQPQGLILVSGPTGSGKTTTLYSILNALNIYEKNIITIEDPVEIKLEGVNQLNVNNKIGLTFALLLRSILRQDPDVIMVGEIRDQETAEIAIKAAQTGHLVLATIHSNSTVETIMRFNSMQIPTYNLANSLILIISQRLVRTLCKYCKNDLEKNFCENCNGGFAGRQGIFELLHINNAIRKLLYETNNPVIILNEAIKNGMLSLKASGGELISKDITLCSEILRVVSDCE